MYFFGVRVSDNVGGDGWMDRQRWRETDVNVREMDRDRGRQIDNVGERDRCSCERQLLMGDGQMETDIIVREGWTDVNGRQMGRRMLM